jgi:hypothetical protein
MSALAIVWWIFYILWVANGFRRYYPYTGPALNYANDLMLVILVLIIGLVLFPLRG